MNIAIIDMDSLKNPFWAAGQARATREVAKRMAKKHQVQVFTSKYPGYSDYVEDRIQYTHVGLNSTNPRLLNLFFLLNIPLLAKKIKADVIIENFNAPTSVSLAPVFTKTPIVALPTMFNAIQFSKKYGVPFHLIEKYGLKKYKYMLPYSEVDSAKAKKLNPGITYKVVQQGVDDEYLKIKRVLPKHILFLGRFDFDQKGVDLLLESYAQVADKIEYPLVIAGHGPDEAKLLKLVDSLGLKNKVKVVGPSYGDKKKKLMSEAVAVAFPSRHDEICLWTLEALAAGLPIVCFDLPESKWLTKKVALKAKTFEKNHFSKLLLQICDPKLNKRMSREARRLAKKFTWTKVSKNIEDFLNQVLKMEGQIEKN